MTGQKEQFGCIAMNRAYDHMSVHISCDGAVRTPIGPSEESLRERKLSALKTSVEVRFIIDDVWVRDPPGLL